MIDAAHLRVGSWWAHEWRDLRERRPGFASALTAVAARPAVLVVAAALIAGVLGAGIPGGDARWFQSAGRSMLGPDAFDVYANPGLQIGPLYLLAVGLLAAAADVVGLPVLFTVAAVQAAVNVALALETVRRWAVHRGVPVRPAQWGVAAPLAIGGLMAESVGNGHPEEIFLGLLLALVALAVAEGRPWAPGLLLGLGVGIKLWACLGAPIVLVRGRRFREMVRDGLTTMIVVAAAYGPFFAFGDVRTFEFSWGSLGSPLSALAAELGWGDWALRVLQGALVLLAGGLTGLVLRRSGLAVVLVILGVRLALDPLSMTYYSGPLLVVLLAWVWTGDPRLRRWGPGLSLAVPALVLAPYFLPATVHDAALRLGYVLVVLAAVLRRVASEGQEQMVTSTTVAEPPVATTRTPESGISRTSG